VDTIVCIFTSPKSPVQRLVSRSSNVERGDHPIHGFWAHGTSAIIDACVTDTDAKLSSWSHDFHKVLATQELDKKKKYL
jgi:hypothetical protein